MASPSKTAGTSKKIDSKTIKIEMSGSVKVPTKAIPNAPRYRKNTVIP